MGVTDEPFEVSLDDPPPGGAKPDDQWWLGRGFGTRESAMAAGMTEPA